MKKYKNNTHEKLDFLIYSYSSRRAESLEQNSSNNLGLSTRKFTTISGRLSLPVPHVVLTWLRIKRRVFGLRAHTGIPRTHESSLRGGNIRKYARVLAECLSKSSNQLSRGVRGWGRTLPPVCRQTSCVSAIARCVPAVGINLALEYIKREWEREWERERESRRKSGRTSGRTLRGMCIFMRVESRLRRDAGDGMLEQVVDGLVWERHFFGCFDDNSYMKESQSPWLTAYIMSFSSKFLWQTAHALWICKWKRWYIK